MKTDIFRFFSQRPNLKYNRKVFVFALCLLISCFTWLQINLSKRYTDNILIRISFVNLPKARFGVSELTDTLSVEVEGDGYSLLKYEMQDVQVEYKKLKRDFHAGYYYFMPNNNVKFIARQLNNNLNIIRSTSDTLRINTIR